MEADFICRTSPRPGDRCIGTYVTMPLSAKLLLTQAVHAWLGRILYRCYKYQIIRVLLLPPDPYVISSQDPYSTASLLSLVTIHHKTLRYCVYGLCTLILSLGLTMTFSWFFDCEPVLSNFVWSIQNGSCVNYDIFRYCECVDERRCRLLTGTQYGLV